MSPEEQKTEEEPQLKQLRLEDTTIEAAQNAMLNNPDGMVTLQDELGGWFGSIDRYTGGRGASNRGFWLQTWSGGGLPVNRVGRGTFFIENIGISMLGGIQPEVIQKVASESYDDGLIQRLLPVVLNQATLGHDEPIPPVADEYAQLIDRLYQLSPDAIKAPNYFLVGGHFEFDDEAQAVRREMEQRHLELQKLELINKKLGSHFGKLNGYFSRLCLIWHCIEDTTSQQYISGGTARRVAKFMSDFLLPHALAFYAGILNLSDNHDTLTAITGYILAHRLDVITTRDIARGDRTMQKLTRRDTEAVFEQLEALAWVTRVPGPRPSSPPQWVVNPRCHELFAERAAGEAAHRMEVRRIMANLPRRKPNATE
jgi:Protein of unknown function (DUF3987)